MERQSSRHWLRICALVLVVALLAGTFFLLPGRAADTSSFGKLTDSYTPGSGSFTLDGNSRFFIPSGSTAPDPALVELVQLAQQQFAAAGYPNNDVMPIVWGKSDLVQSGDILIRLDPASGVGAEGYRLDVGSYASVTAQDVRGMLYGLNALLKHFMTGGNSKIQGFTSVDVPDTTERTVMLDMARKYYSKEWICNFIRQMAWMGYNTLQLHLAEDSGIRMDIWDPAYYKGSFQPANDFSWICGSENAYYIGIFSPGGVVQTDVHKDRYLSTAEMIEILETAKKYQISVIPSFDSPGHMDYLNWKYEDNYLKNTDYTFYSRKDGKTYAAKDIQGVINYTNAKSANITPIRNKPYFKAVNIKNAQAKAFVFELYTDIATFFKEYSGSTDFSICADEVVLSDTLASGYSFQFGYGDFVSYINELNAHLNGLGYTCRAYNDFIGHTSHASGYPLSSFADNLEIMYWSSSYNSGTGSSTTSKDVYYFDGDRPLYNCISNHTYFAMAYHKSNSHPDCRCPSNYSWTMGYGTEDIVYNNWAPNDFTARGKYNSASMKVAAKDLSGGYFLIWSDNPMLSTESEIWNGFWSCDNDHLYVSLKDRMWSNAIKMWNWDVNSTVTFANFTAVRDKIKVFPGIGKDGSGLDTCSAAPVYAAATEPVALADRDTLAAALAGKLSPEMYTQASYHIYENAYAAVQAAYDDPRTTEAQMRDVIGALERAKSDLMPLTFTITVEHQLPDGNVSQTFDMDTSHGTCEIYLAGFAGHVFHSSDVGTFRPLSSGNSSGYLTVPAISDTTVHVRYVSSVDDSHLQTLIRNAVTQPSKDYYTPASWNAYQKALEAAKDFSIAPGTRQSQIDALVDALERAHAALVTTAPGTSQLVVETLHDSFQAGKTVVFYVTTGPDAATLTVTCDGQTVDPDTCSGEIQELDGQTVKRWMVSFTAPAPGTYTYTLTDGTNTRNITVTVG